MTHICTCAQQGFHSPYYRESHKKFRAQCRKFVEEEMKPQREEWIKAGAYPQALHEKAYAAGLGGLLYPPEYGGSKCPRSAHSCMHRC